MPRGRLLARYVADDGSAWAYGVDRDRFADAERGWTSAVGLGLPRLPRGWQPRYVLGMDATGRYHQAVVGTTAATLWTGAATSFQVEASDGTLVTVAVLGRVAERTFRS